MIPSHPSLSTNLNMVWERMWTSSSLFNIFSAWPYYLEIFLIFKGSILLYWILQLVIHSDFNKIVTICLQMRPLSIHLIQFQLTTQRSIPLYFTKDSTNNSQLISMDQFNCVDLRPSHSNSFPHGASYMQCTLVAPPFRSSPMTHFVQLWDHIGICHYGVLGRFYH